MDKSEINRRMAEEVMGWHHKLPSGIVSSHYWCDEKGIRIMIVDYDPAEDMNQAMEAVIRCLTNKTIYYFVLAPEALDFTKWRAFAGRHVVADAPAKDICLALLEAVENMKKEN